MSTIAFISGKGGTGKTSLVASFARLAAPVVVAECDVDAANIGLLIPGRRERSERFVSGVRARIDPDRCRDPPLPAERRTVNITRSGAAGPTPDVTQPEARRRREPPAQ